MSLDFIRDKNNSAGQILREVTRTAASISRRELYRKKGDDKGAYLLVCRSQVDSVRNFYCAVCGFERDEVETMLTLLGITEYSLLASVHLTIPVPELTATELVVRELDFCDLREPVAPGEKMRTFKALVLAELGVSDTSYRVPFKIRNFEHVEDTLKDYVEIVFYAHRFKNDMLKIGAEDDEQPD